MDIAALARHLGYTTSTIRTYMVRQRWHKVPPPSRRLTVGPIWYLGDVEEWQRAKGEAMR